MLVTQRSQRRHKDTQRIFNNKTLSILVLLFFTTTLLSSESEVDDSKSNLDLAQIIRSIALIYTDDELDPEVEKFINHQPEIIWEDNAYVYLWGMDKVTENPYATGKEILEKLVEDDKHYNYEQRPLNFDFLEDYSILEIPNNDLLCKKKDIECIEIILNNNSRIESFLVDFDSNRLRYLKFLNFNHFSQIANRRLESPMPNYRMITHAQKIHHITLLKELNKLNNSNIANQLVYELNRLKILLGNADTLIAKMIVLSLINENIDFFNYLFQKENLNLKMSSSVFRPLSTSERSLYNAMYEEHSRNLKMMFDWASDYKTLIRKQYNPYTDAIMKMIYFVIVKPNLTVNAIYNDYIKKLLIMTQSPLDFYYANANNLNKKIKHDFIRNYGTYKWMGGAMPEYFEYQIRVFDIDMKLQLMRLFIESESIDNLKMHEDYLNSYDKSLPFKEESRWCYAGKYNNFREYRCLNIY